MFYYVFMKYKYFLFDIDNTLLDFHKAEEQAFKNASAIFNIRCSDEDYRRYSAINDGYWKKLEKGLCTREEVTKNRFKDYLPTVNATNINPVEFNSTYLNQLSLGNQLIDGADEVIKQISLLGGEIYIATNGILKVQTKRLSTLSFMKYVKGVFVSEDLGYSKPNVKFFEEAEKRANISLKGNSIIIGDSLTSDIKGGSDFGIDTCWFNPKNLPIPETPKITFSITKLLDLIEKVR